jgi:YVTN family beta-propeller protein
VAWVSLYNSSKVVAIDLQQGKVVGSAPVGKILKVVAVSPDGDWVYVANWSSASVSVINSHTIQHVKDVAVGHVPRGICFNGSLAYVAIMGGSQVTLVDTAKDHTVVGKLASGFNPRHVVLSPDAKTLFVSNNAPGTVTVIDLNKGKPVATMKVGKMPRTIAIAPQGDALFVCNYKSDNLGIIDLNKRKQVALQKTVIRPIGASISPAGATIWVSSYPTSVVQVFRITRE